MDLKQEQSDIIASFELPGMKKEDVKIDLHGDRLTISGECTTSTSREEDNYVVRERSCGSFSRTLAVPSGTKVRVLDSLRRRTALTCGRQREDVKASMEHGVLSVTLPKAAEHQQPQRIDIA